MRERKSDNVLFLGQNYFTCFIYFNVTFFSRWTLWLLEEKNLGGNFQNCMFLCILVLKKRRDLDTITLTLILGIAKMFKWMSNPSVVLIDGVHNLSKLHTRIANVFTFLNRQVSVCKTINCVFLIFYSWWAPFKFLGAEHISYSVAILLILLIISCTQTDGSVPNTLVIANCEVVKPRVAAAEHISQVTLLWMVITPFSATRPHLISSISDWIGFASLHNYIILFLLNLTVQWRSTLTLCKEI